MERIRLVWHIAQRVSSLFAGIGKIAAAKGLNGGFQHNAHVFKCWRANGALFIFESTASCPSALAVCDSLS